MTRHEDLIQQIELLTEKLEHVNNELDQLSYAITHDLQDPLRATTSFAQLLLKRYEGQLDTPSKEMVLHVVSGTKQMQIMIDDLVNYLQLESDQYHSDVDCNVIIKKILFDCTTIINEKNAIITHDELPIVTASPIHLKQLFSHLVTNALLFQKNQPPRIHISVEIKADSWLFSVADNGIGIEKKHTSHIFRIFQRLHTQKEYVGRGTGLAICKKIVESYGGKIWVESQLNHGSTFYFTIPKQRRYESKPIKR